MRVKNTVAALAAIAALGAPLAAQTVGVPDNDPTMGICNSFPMASSTEWRYQQLIPASALPAARFKITDMAYAPCNSGTETYRAFQVRMALTTLTALTNNFDTNLGRCPVTVLNSPSFTWNYTANTWSLLGLQCAFAHDGVRNLVVEVRYSNRAGSGTSCHRDTLPRAYTSGAGASSNPTASTVTTGALKIQFTIDRTCVLFHSPEPEIVQVGSAAKLGVQTAPAGAPYQIATALGHATQLSVGSCSICLNPDIIFLLSISGNPLFSGYAGTVSASGFYSGAYMVPNIPALAGICLSHASITINPVCCTNTITSLIVP